MHNNLEIENLVRETLITAGSTFRQDKKDAYKEAFDRERNERAKWVLEQIIENAEVAEKNRSPLCDDTGIPHLVLEIGEDRAISGAQLKAIYKGIEKGLHDLPGRPMAICGSDIERLEQKSGLAKESNAVLPAPLLTKLVPGDTLRLHVMMFGGGPAIRGKSYRVFHKHDIEVIKKEIIEWAKESTAQLGCTPTVLAVGIGRSHYEASALMLEAQVYSDFNKQSDIETEITEGINKSCIGALGLGGDTTVLKTFIKIGPQRASGVRIVCMRPCCCFEPRICSVDL